MPNTRTCRPCVGAAALQANMALHRLNQAAATRPRRSSGTDSAIALDGATKNCAISANHLPSASDHCCQDDQTGSASFASEVKVCPLFLPLGCCRCNACSCRSTWTCRAISSESRHQCGVDGQLCTTECCQSVCHNLKSPIVHDVERRQVLVTHKHVCGDAGPSFSAHLRCGHFQGSNPSDPTPLNRNTLRDGGLVNQNWRPHRQVRGTGAEGA